MRSAGKHSSSVVVCSRVAEDRIRLWLCDFITLKNTRDGTNSFRKFPIVSVFICLVWSFNVAEDEWRLKKEEENELRRKSSYSKFHEKFKWARSHYVVIFLSSFAGFSLLVDFSHVKTIRTNQRTHSDRNEFKKCSRTAWNWIIKM